MTERDVLTVARSLVLLLGDTHATIWRLLDNGWLTDQGRAVALAFQERLLKALKDAERLL